MHAITSKRNGIVSTVLVTIVALISGTTVAKGIPFYGTISGQISEARAPSRPVGAVLPGFGINSPVFVGDQVTGSYSYDSLTQDTDLFTARDINITLIFGNPANTLGYFGLGPFLYSFKVKEGVPTFFSVDDSHSPDFSLHFSVSESWFNLVEMDGLGAPRQISGTLTCVPVPESGGIVLWLTLATAWLVLLERRNRERDRSGFIRPHLN